MEEHRRLIQSVQTQIGGQIKYIEEINNKYEWLGYRIQCDLTEIVIKISGSRLSCEEYGVYCNSQRREECIGRSITQINLYDRRGSLDRDWRCEKSLIVELVTDNGSLEFILYCAHNGYYAHDYYVRIDNQIWKGCL
jgi:hypothetical protein